MSTFVLCVGCGTPLYGFSPCQWCTCELCGNNLRDGFCSLCNSRNSCVYDPNPNSFDFPPDSCHPPHLAYETYSCDSYGNDSHFGYDCQPQFLINYESKPGYIKNYNSYPCDSSSFPQQELCCKDCGDLSEADHCQPSQYTIPACCDDDDDYDSAITTNEPVDSLSMGDEHLNTIPEMESDEFIKSCVENLVPNPSESEGENGCDVHACFTTFKNILFDADYESDSSDDLSCSDEDILEEIYLNPFFEEEIIPMKIYMHHFNAESDLIESLLNHDSSIIPSSKIDSLFDEFASELNLLKSIPPEIDKTDCYPENEFRFTKRLLYDNSSPRPPEEFVSENSNAEIESFSRSPIPVKDSNSQMEEIDLFLTPDDPMPPSIEDDDDYDSKRDILILEEFPRNYSLSLPENESFHFDIPSFSRPPAKPPDGNTGILNIKMMGDISDQKGLENFQLSAKCPMMIHGKNIPILDIPLFHFYPLEQLKYEENWVKLSDLKQALRGRHPMLIRIVQHSRKCEDSCQRILSSKSSFPQLQLGI
nr:hypothetical protein [Tanacetum cinerariifolium]